MLKVFISMPMRGLKDDQIKNRREDIIQKLFEIYGKENIRILDSYFEDDSQEPVGSKKGLWYLGRSLQLMSEADIIVAARGAEYGRNRGCEIEMHAAREYGPFLFISEESLYDYDFSQMPIEEAVTCKGCEPTRSPDTL